MNTAHSARISASQVTTHNKQKGAPTASPYPQHHQQVDQLGEAHLSALQPRRESRLGQVSFSWFQTSNATQVIPLISRRDVPVGVAWHRSDQSEPLPRWLRPKSGPAGLREYDGPRSNDPRNLSLSGRPCKTAPRSTSCRQLGSWISPQHITSSNTLGHLAIRPRLPSNFSGLKHRAWAPRRAPCPMLIRSHELFKTPPYPRWAHLPRPHGMSDVPRPQEEVR